jgi:hypothetical protein
LLKSVVAVFAHLAGFNVETVKYNNISFTVWDVGGQERIRRLWRHYFEDTDGMLGVLIILAVLLSQFVGLIYVVDSNDRVRIQESAKELRSILQEESLRDAAVLVFCNKQDLPGMLFFFVERFFSFLICWLPLPLAHVLLLFSSLPLSSCRCCNCSRSGRRPGHATNPPERLARASERGDEW